MTPISYAMGTTLAAQAALTGMFCDAMSAQARQFSRSVAGLSGAGDGARPSRSEPAATGFAAVVPPLPAPSAAAPRSEASSAASAPARPATPPMSGPAGAH